MATRRGVGRAAAAAMLAVTMGFGLTPAEPVAAVDTPLSFADQYSFGERTVGSTTPVDLIVSNDGPAPIGPLTITGGEPPSAAFALTATTCTGFVVAPGASCTITFSFTPTAAGGVTDTATFTAAGEEFSVLLAGIGLAQTGTISGSITLTNAAAGAERNVYVTALDGSTKHQFSNVAANYSVAVPAGTYCVSFGIGPWEGTVSSYPNKRHCRDGITPVTVSAGATVSAIDATLTLSSISGTLRDHLGAAVPSERVFAAPALGIGSAENATGGAGDFTIENLPAGTYCLRAASGTADAASSPCPAGTRRVEVGAGADVTGVTLTLPAPGGSGDPTGAISGRVGFGAPITPLADREVRAEGLDEFGGFASTTTAADGTYSLGGLPPGPYCVYVIDDAGEPYAGEHYVDASDCDTATPVTVGSAAVTGIDFSLPPGSTISGTVTNPGGGNPFFAFVTAQKIGTFRQVTANVGGGGSYSITGLSPGQYCVIATDALGDLPPRTFGGGYSCEGTFTTVTVGTGAAITGIDIQFANGGRIAGTVTFPAGVVPGEGAGRLLISSRDEWGEQSQYVDVDLRGRFSLDGLVPGLHCLNARAPSPSLLVSKNVGSVDPDSCRAGEITVTAGGTTTVDFTMELGGSISGWVVLPDNRPDPDPNPRLTPFAGENDRVRPDGSYHLTGVAAGTYCVTMFGSRFWTLTQAYDGVPSCDAGATPVTVTAGQNTGNINFTLQAGGLVSGTITFPGTSSRTRVEFHRIDTAQPVITDEAFTTGPTTAQYTGAVPPGTYCVLVRPNAATGFANRAHGGTPSCTGATPVVVTGVSKTTGIDVTLTRQIYTGLASPARLMDTRAGATTVDGVAAGGGAIVGGTVRELQVGGRAGIPVDAASVALNVTATNTTGPGFLTVFPCGLPAPNASNVNYTAAGQTTPNAVVAKLGTDGTLCIFALTTADVIVDVAGSFPDDDGFVPLDTPARLLDTRPGQPVAPGGASGGGAIASGTVREVQIGGLAAVPADAASVALNVTATNTIGPGFLTVFPCGQPAPNASNVNFTGAGQTTPNAVVAKLGTDGKLCIFALTTADVIVDVAGYFANADGLAPLTNPVRVLDTRAGATTVDGLGAGGGAIVGGTAREVQVGGRAGLPSGAASVALNVTATNTTGPGFLTVFPCGRPAPNASNVNYTAAGQTTPNAVVAKLGTDGRICVFALTTTDVIIDVAGYLPEGDGPEVVDVD